MKKRFLRFGIFTGALVSAFALASCNGDSPEPETPPEEKTTAKVKDLSGNDYEIEETTDSNKALMSLFLAANTVKDTNKHYALGTTLRVDANVSGTMPGATVSLDAAVSTSVKASIGKNSYTSIYDFSRPLEGQTPTETQLATALDEFSKNFKSEATLSAKVKTKVTTTETQSLTTEEQGQGQQSGDTQEAPNMMEMLMTMLADADIDVEASLFTKAPATTSEKLRVYGEVSAKLPVVFDDFGGMAQQFLPTMTKTAATDGKTSNYGYNFYMEDLMDPEIAAMLTSIFATYQNASTNIGAIDKLGKSGILGSGSTLVSTVLTGGVETVFNENFFTSNTYTQVQNVAKELGLKVSSINNGKVTFTLDCTGKALNTIQDMSNQATTNNNLTALATKMFDDDKTYSKLELAIDVQNGIISKYKVTIPEIADIFNVVKGTTRNQNIKAITLAGTYSMEVACDVDDSVSFTKTPSASKTYALLDIPAIVDEIKEAMGSSQQQGQGQQTGNEQQEI